MAKYNTKFAIVTADYTHLCFMEYCGMDKFGRPKFVEMEIPHKGKRYKVFSNAVGVANELNDRGYNVKVIETLL